MSDVDIPVDPLDGNAQREVVLGVLVIAVMVVVAWLSTVAINGSPFGGSYRVKLPIPASGPVVKDGDEVRMAGERVGQVRAVDLAPGGRGSIATLELSDRKLGAGATARVRLRGLAGAIYVELTRGDPSHELKSGSSLPAGSSSAAPQLTEVVAGFDAETRRVLARTVGVTGAGLSGRGTGLNRALGELEQTLRTMTPQLRAFAPGEAQLTGLLDAADRVSAAAAPAGTTDLAGAVRGAAGVLETTGARSPALKRTLAALPGLQSEITRTLPGTTGLLRDLGGAATELRPGVAALDAALAALQRVENRRTGLDTLARLGRLATPVVGAATPLVGHLEGTSRALGPIADPVAELGRVLVPYRQELIDGPGGFTRWGDFKYADGQGAGHRAVRFSMILTCAKKRDPYPAPGQASTERSKCP